MRNLFFLMCMVMGTWGCSTLQVPQVNYAQQLDGKKDYRMDLQVEVNGLSGKGLLVAPQEDHYDIVVQAPAKSEYVVISSSLTNAESHSGTDISPQSWSEIIALCL